MIPTYLLILYRTMAVCDCPVGASSGPTLASTCGGSQFMLFMGLLEVFIRSQCDLEDPCGRASPRVSNSDNQDQIISFFIVVSIRA